MVLLVLLVFKKLYIKLELSLFMHYVLGQVCSGAFILQ